MEHYQQLAANYDQGPLFASLEPGPGAYGLMQRIEPEGLMTYVAPQVLSYEQLQRYIEEHYGLGDKEKRMQKTFCDLCGAQTVNWRIRMHLSVIHTTNQDEGVGEDEYKPLDVCKRCASLPLVLLEILTTKMRMYGKEAPVGEDVMAEDGRGMDAPRVEIGPGAIMVSEVPD